MIFAEIFTEPCRNCGKFQTIAGGRCISRIFPKEEERFEKKKDPNLAENISDRKPRFGIVSFLDVSFAASSAVCQPEIRGVFSFFGSLRKLFRQYKKYKNSVISYFYVGLVLGCIEAELCK